MIPERGDIRIAPAWLDDLADRQFQVECGFDMTPFNRLLPQRIALGGKVKGLELRGDAVSLFSFDLRSTQAADTRVEVDLLADRGPVNGVVQWIGLKLDEAEYYENRPDPGSWSHWACQFLPLAQTIESTGEKAIRIAGSHKDGRLRLWQV